MLKDKLLLALIIPTLVLSSCIIPISIGGSNNPTVDKPSSVTPTVKNSATPISVIDDIGEDQVKDPSDSKPLIVSTSSPKITSPSPSVAIPTATPVITNTPVPIKEVRYVLVKKEVEVNLPGFTPDGIHGGEPARKTFYFKGDLKDLQLPAYDPLRGLLDVKEGNIVFSWSYDENKNWKTSGGWSEPPSIVKDGDILPVEEFSTLHSRVGPFVEGNVNSRVHFGGSSYYYLVKGDGQYGEDPNIIWYNNGNDTGTKIGITMRNKIDVALNVKDHDDFTINMFYQCGNSFVGWWYYYKKEM